MPTSIPPPKAASLPIAKAARLLGVHPNTLRAWADQGRVRCLRVNARGDRRFRVEDLEAFLFEAGAARQPLRYAAAAAGPDAGPDATDREAQIDSIAKLGTRLNRLSTVDEIGTAICLELRQLIDYHNVRVYRVYGDDVVPVAWRGEVGTYIDEDGEQLRLKVGEGITGWVAAHGVAQYLPDAVRDPRGSHVPGTEERLDESMLVAPMLYEDEAIGVIVLSKLGLDRFAPHELRYLGIYASIAAQAMVNADFTSRLRAQKDMLDQQLVTQQELLRVSEGLLTSLDPEAVVAEIADSLAGLIGVDRLGVYVYERGGHTLEPLLARGDGADDFMAQTLSATVGAAAEVLRGGEARRVHLREGRPAAQVLAPLRSQEHVVGILQLERHGRDARFEDREFDLVRLFAAHVSIALQNALAHRAVELRAQTDPLTGLRNHGTFRDDLRAEVERGEGFTLLMLDLDDFKRFNDQHGHEAGNVLLQGIAVALEAACRASDEVYRYAGDEFCLILPGAREADAIEVARRVRRAVRAVRDVDGDRAGMRCSVGVATFPDDADDGAALLLAADRALYAAKRAGRDRVSTAEEGRALGLEVVPPPTPVDDG